MTAWRRSLGIGRWARRSIHTRRRDGLRSKVRRRRRGFGDVANDEIVERERRAGLHVHVEPEYVGRLLLLDRPRVQPSPRVIFRSEIEMSHVDLRPRTHETEIARKPRRSADDCVALDLAKQLAFEWEQTRLGDRACHDSAEVLDAA